MCCILTKFPNHTITFSFRQLFCARFARFYDQSLFRQLISYPNGCGERNFGNARDLNIIYHQ